MSFNLHPQLDADTLLVGDFNLCTIRLMNDSRYLWLILVPRRQGIKEISDLHPNDMELLWGEVMKAHEAVRGLAKPDKMNIGALGNMVPQLHFHVVARKKSDPAWPKPVWGHSPAVPYEDGGASVVADIRKVLGPLSVG